MSDDAQQLALFVLECVQRPLRRGERPPAPIECALRPVPRGERPPRGAQVIGDATFALYDPDDTASGLARAALEAFGAEGPRTVISGWFDDLMTVTGGKAAVAKSMGVSESKLKTIANPTVKDLINSLKVTGAVAGAAGALLIPGVNVTVGASILGGAAVGADALIAASQGTSADAKEAQKIIANTKALAAKGNADAARGMELLAMVDKQRVALKVPAGVPMNIAQRTVLTMNAIVLQNVLADVQRRVAAAAPTDPLAAEKAAAAQLQRLKDTLAKLSPTASTRSALQAAIDKILKTYPALAKAEERAQYEAALKAAKAKAAAEATAKAEAAAKAKAEAAAKAKADAAAKKAAEERARYEAALRAEAEAKAKAEAAAKAKADAAAAAAAAASHRGWLVYAGGIRKGEIRGFGSWVPGPGISGYVVTQDGRIQKGSFASG